jgi:hypothetical protein
MNPGAKPKITLEQYKEILKVKEQKKGDRPKKGTMELTYAKLGGKLGLRPCTIVSAAKKGIKRYDYIIWKESQEEKE